MTLTATNNCIEFTVLQSENIAVVSNNPNVPAGVVTFTILDSNTDEVVYGKMRTIRTQGRTLNQYFTAIDTNGLPKWLVIQNEMIERGIPEITVKVCKANLGILEDQINLNYKTKDDKVHVYEKSNIKNKTQKNKNAQIKSLLILPCTSEKIYGGDELNNINNTFSAHKCLEHSRLNRMKFYNELLLKDDPKEYFNKRRSVDLKPIKFDKSYFTKCQQNPVKYMMAIDRYDGILYTKEIKLLLKEKAKKGLHILIISGLYGVLKYDDHIIDYQLDINKGGFKVWKNNKNDCIGNVLGEYISNNEIKYENVTAVLSNTYIKPIINISKKFGRNIWGLADGYGDNHVVFLKDYLNNL